jgi:HAD superfamily hydrolase (TIGR01509 family)
MADAAGGNALAVIFDLDGLLADTEPIWSESARILLRRRGRRYDPSLKPRVMGRHPAWVIRLIIDHHHLDDEPETLLQERLEILSELYRTGEIPIMPGARGLVTGLARRQVPMAVASGSPKSVVQLVLERLGLRRHLQATVGSNEVSRGKPHPDLFLEAARRIGAEPKRCVVLEDAISGIEAALAAQMAVVAVPGSEIPDEVLTRAHRVVGSLTELTPEALVKVIR